MTEQSPADEPKAPLAGIQVLDVSSVLSGPLTAMLLADLGADVIKVENPSAPDFTRSTGNRRDGMTAYYYNVNRGKRSLAVDGRQPSGREILKRLAKRSDVIVQNMRPGKAAKIGLGPEECLERNPSLVYLSISGYGATGPAADEPVYDYVIQAVTGMVELQRDPSTGRADLARHFPADKNTSHAAVEAVLAALFARERDPERRGQHVEVSMHEANLAYFWPDGMMQHAIVGEPDGDDVYPGDFYRVYPTTDGDIVLMPLMGPLPGVCRAAGHEEWIEEFPELNAENLHRFQDKLAAAVAEFSTSEALAAFGAEDVPAGSVAALEDVHIHPQAQARGTFNEHDAAVIGPIRSHRPPWRLHGTPEVVHTDAPLLGQHTGQILGELGYDAEAIEALQMTRVIEIPSPLSARSEP